MRSEMFGKFGSGSFNVLSCILSCNFPVYYLELSGLACICLDFHGSVWNKMKLFGVPSNCLEYHPTVLTPMQPSCPPWKWLHYHATDLTYNNMYVIYTILYNQVHGIFLYTDNVQNKICYQNEFVWVLVSSFTLDYNKWRNHLEDNRTSSVDNTSRTDSVAKEEEL